MSCHWEIYKSIPLLISVLGCNFSYVQSVKCSMLLRYRPSVHRKYKRERSSLGSLKHSELIRGLRETTQESLVTVGVKATLGTHRVAHVCKHKLMSNSKSYTRSKNRPKSKFYILFSVTTSPNVLILILMLLAFKFLNDQLF